MNARVGAVVVVGKQKRSDDRKERTTKKTERNSDSFESGVRSSRVHGARGDSKSVRTVSRSAEKRDEKFGG